MNKEFTITIHHRGRVSEVTGDMNYLIDYFGYKLDTAYDYNPKINRRPKTAKSLVSSLNKAVRELQGGCFEQDYYEFVS